MPGGLRRVVLTTHTSTFPAKSVQRKAWVFGAELDDDK